MRSRYLSVFVCLLAIVAGLTVSAGTAKKNSTSEYQTIQYGVGITALQAGALPDSCDLQTPGDADGNTSIEMADGFYILGFLGGGPAPIPLANGDANGDCVIDSADADYIFAFVLGSGPAPVACTCVEPYVDSCVYQTPGDVNGTGSVGMDDAAFIATFLYAGGPAPDPLANGDVNGDCVIDTFDIVYITEYVFAQGPPPVECTCVEPLVPSDTCSAQMPGDADGNGSITPFDIPFLSAYLYSGGAAPNPLANGDPNGDCCIDTFDIVYLTDYLFNFGPAPVECTCVEPSTLCTDLCTNSFADPVFVICPGGDAIFEVHIRDEFDQPVTGFSDVWLVLSACESMSLCPGQPGLDSIPPLGPSDAAGVIRFSLAGGGCDGDCLAAVRIGTSACEIATVPVISYDVNGDLGVGLAEYDGGSLCCDYDGDGDTDDNDFELFLVHHGHYCGLSECERFSSEFVLTPPTNHLPGSTVNLDLVLSNGNYDSCYIGLIEFYYSPAGSGQNETWFHSDFFEHSLAPGEKDTVSTSYTVPAFGDGCLIVRFDTECCSTTVEHSACLDYESRCTADTVLCYEFSIFLSGTPTVVAIDTIMQYLNPNWPPLEVLHWPAAIPVTSPDYIQYRICTAVNAELADDSKMFTLIWEEGAAAPRTFRNAVLITPQTGDCNGDCLVNVTDAVYIIQYIFAGGDEPLPYRAGDVNCDEIVNITDAVYLINYIFSGGPEPCLIE